MIMKEKKYLKILLVLIWIIPVVSCKDFLKVAPAADQVETGIVYANDETAEMAGRGQYVTMAALGGFASGGVGCYAFFGGRSADEFTEYSTVANYIQFTQNNLLPINTNLRTALWQNPYKVIYGANAIMENLKRSSDISESVKSRLTGEALFMRAFCYFYLTNLFGNVPLVLTTDYRINAVAFASTQDDIYRQIIRDLQEAKTLLPDNYLSADRLRANKWAASALLARAYLYHKEWANAETEASFVIANTALYQLKTDLDQIFLKNSTEAILQFYLTGTSVNTHEGNFFILTAAPLTSSGVTISPGLLAAFEPGDQRASKWVGTFTSGTTSYKYPFKYKVKGVASPVTEYSMILRLAEQYLIRAEARIEQNNVDAGIADLNVIRTRARATPSIGEPNPLPNLPNGLSQANARLAVEQERRIEFFSEWGHRWLDLKRTGRATPVLAPIKGANWQSTDVLYPIPATELANNPNLKQNEGY